MSRDPSASNEIQDVIGPRIGLPAKGAPAGVVLVCMLAAGGALFLFLDGRDPTPRRRATAASSAHWPSPPPPLDIPPPAPAPPPPPPTVEYVYKTAPPPEPIVRYVDRVAPPPMPAAPVMPIRLNEPALVVDTGEAPAPQSAAGADAAARAVTLRGRSALVPQGTLIPAVLETPVDTAQPGPVRALTSKDTRSFDGTRVLIPRGSRLLGELRTDGGAGQTRTLITWNRLLRPDGVSVRLTSPTSDAVGSAGVAGQADTHLLARVANVALQTALVVGADLATRPGNGSVVLSSPGQALANAGQTLVPTNELKRTIRVKKGAEITIFVARDLDFRGAAETGP